MSSGACITDRQTDKVKYRVDTYWLGGKYHINLVKNLYNSHYAFALYLTLSGCFEKLKKCDLVDCYKR